MKYFTKITAPDLTKSDYGNNLAQVFNNIDQNFQKIMSLPFLKGENGDSLMTKIEHFWEEKKLTKIGSMVYNMVFNPDKLPELENLFAPGDSYEEFKLKLKIYEIKYQDKKFARIAAQKSVWDTIGPDADPKISIYYIIKDNKTFNLGIPQAYYFIDPRLDHITNNPFSIDNKVLAEFNDLSCILFSDPKPFTQEMIDNEEIKDGDYIFDIIHGEGWPSIYYENGQFSWKINGVKTGINAQGVRGQDGDGSRVWIARCTEPREPYLEKVADKNKIAQKSYMFQFPISKIFNIFSNKWVDVHTDPNTNEDEELEIEPRPPRDGDVVVCYVLNGTEMGSQDPIIETTYNEIENIPDSQLSPQMKQIMKQRALTIQRPYTIVGVYHIKKNKHYVIADLFNTISSNIDIIHLTKALNFIGNTSLDNNVSTNLQGIYLPTPAIYRDQFDSSKNQLVVHSIFTESYNKSSKIKNIPISLNISPTLINEMNSNKPFDWNKGTLLKPDWTDEHHEKWDDLNIFYKTNLYSGSMKVFKQNDENKSISDKSGKQILNINENNTTFWTNKFQLFNDDTSERNIIDIQHLRIPVRPGFRPVRPGRRSTSRNSAGPTLYNKQINLTINADVSRVISNKSLELSGSVYKNYMNNISFLQSHIFINQSNLNFNFRYDEDVDVVVDSDNNKYGISIVPESRESEVLDGLYFHTRYDYDSKHKTYNYGGPVNIYTTFGGENRFAADNVKKIASVTPTGVTVTSETKFTNGLNTTFVGDAKPNKSDLIYINNYGGYNIEQSNVNNYKFCDLSSHLNITETLPNIDLFFEPFTDIDKTDLEGFPVLNSYIYVKINAPIEWFNKYKDQIHIDLFKYTKNRHQGYKRRWVICDDQNANELDSYKENYYIYRFLLSKCDVNEISAKETTYPYVVIKYPYSIYHIFKRYLTASKHITTQNSGSNIYLNNNGEGNELSLFNILKYGHMKNSKSNRLGWITNTNEIRILGQDEVNKVEITAEDRIKPEFWKFTKIFTNGYSANLQMRLTLDKNRNCGNDFNGAFSNQSSMTYGRKYSPAAPFKIHFGFKDCGSINGPWQKKIERPYAMKLEFDTDVFKGKRTYYRVGYQPDIPFDDPTYKPIKKNVNGSYTWICTDEKDKELKYYVYTQGYTNIKTDSEETIYSEPDCKKDSKISGVRIMRASMETAGYYDDYEQIRLACTGAQKNYHR